MAKVTKVNTQNNTAVAIPKSVSGVAENKKMLSELKAQEKILAKEFSNLEKGSLRIMFALHEISDKTLYKVAKDEKGKAYKNIYDYASDNYGIARGTCSEYIKLIERFAERDELGQFTGQIIEKFASFKTSVLARLQPYALEDIELMMSDYGLTEKSSYREVAKILKEYNADDLIGVKPDTTAEESAPEESDTTAPEDAEESTAEDSEESKKVYVGVKFGTIRTIEELDSLKDSISEILKSGRVVDLYFANDAVTSMPKPEEARPEVPEEEKPKGRKAKTPMNQKKSK